MNGSDQTTLQAVALARHRKAHTATLGQVWEAVAVMVEKEHPQAQAAQDYLLEWVRTKGGEGLEGRDFIQRVCDEPFVD